MRGFRGLETRLAEQSKAPSVEHRECVKLREGFFLRMVPGIVYLLLCTTLTT